MDLQRRNGNADDVARKNLQAKAAKINLAAKKQAAKKQTDLAVSLELLITN
jgi:hypothetical protein